MNGERLDIALVKSCGASPAESVCAPETFPQMGRAFRGDNPCQPARTDTQSDVSVAVSQERHCFVTHSATDQRLVSSENVPKSQPLKQGGRGSDISAWERLLNPI